MAEASRDKSMSHSCYKDFWQNLQWPKSNILSGRADRSPVHLILSLTVNGDWLGAPLVHYYFFFFPPRKYNYVYSLGRNYCFEWFKAKSFFPYPLVISHQEKYFLKRSLQNSGVTFNINNLVILLKMRRELNLAPSALKEVFLPSSSQRGTKHFIAANWREEEVSFPLSCTIEENFVAKRQQNPTNFQFF